MEATLLRELFTKQARTWSAESGCMMRPFIVS
jgi:hypothetical protein